MTCRPLPLNAALSRSSVPTGYAVIMSRNPDPFPKLTPRVWADLTDSAPLRDSAIINISEDGTLLRFPGSLIRPRVEDISPRCRGLALRVRELQNMLCYDGVNLSRVTIDLDANNELLATIGRGRASTRWSPRSDATGTSPSCTCNLQHGVRFDAWNTSGELSASDVAGFLSIGLGYFKHHRDDLKTDRYAEGAFESQILLNREVRGFLRLTPPSAEALTAAQWVTAVADAYSRPNTVEQMARNLPEWNLTVNREAGRLRVVVSHLNDPRGELLAVA